MDAESEKLTQYHEVPALRIGRRRAMVISLKAFYLANPSGKTCVAVFPNKFIDGKEWLKKNDN